MRTSKPSINIIYELFKQKWKVIALCIVPISILSLIPCIDSIILKSIIDFVSSDIGESDFGTTKFYSTAIMWALIYFVSWESINWIGRLYDYIYLKNIPTVKASILSYFFDYAQGHSHDFFNENFMGYISNCVMEASRSAEMIISFIIENVFRRMASIAATIVTMYFVHYIFAIIFLVWIMVFISLNMLATKYIHTYSKRYARSKSDLSGKIIDVITNITSVRIFNHHKYERKYISRYIEDTVHTDQVMQWFMLKLRYFLGLSCSLMIVSIVYQLIKLKSLGMITIGDLALVINLCASFGDDIWELAQEIGDIFEELGAFSQSVSLLEPYSINDAVDAKDIIVTDGHIKFKNVYFGYKGKDILLKNQCIEILPYEKVGVVGPSGSGKTTLANLISRFYDPSQGSILIDGQDISLVTQESLRANIGIIPQSPMLFNRTIKENIGYGTNATDEEIYHVAKEAYLEDLISSLPNGYLTECGERGEKLSGGQRQRIIIARIMLKNPKILILDEATSALDAKTEAIIRKSINKLAKNKTVIAIAHRMATLLDMDRIIVLYNGAVVEEGTHEHLMSLDGLYKELWNSQI